MSTASTRQHFPPQFWLMFSGLVLSSTGTTMIWPFMLVYVSEKLGQPLTAATSLMTINSIFSSSRPSWLAPSRIAWAESS